MGIAYPAEVGRTVQYRDTNGKTRPAVVTAISATLNVTAASRTSNIVTLTVGNSLAAGAWVVVNLANDSYDGLFRLTAANGTSVTYTQVAANAGTSTGTLQDVSTATLRVGHHGETYATKVRSNGITYTENFTGANADLAAATVQLSWARKVFNAPAKYTVTSNQAVLSTSTAGTHEDLLVPTPNTNLFNVSASCSTTAITIPSAGDYVVDSGAVVRAAFNSNDTAYQGYAAAAGRNNVFFGSVPLWHLILFRIDYGVPATLIASAFNANIGGIVLPGTFTLSASGSTISASFTHSGADPALSATAVDKTYGGGVVAIGGSIQTAGTLGSITVDNFAFNSFAKNDRWTP